MNQPEGKDIKSWVLHNSVLLLGELRSSSESILYSKRMPLVIIFLTIDWSYPEGNTINKQCLL